MSAQPQLWLLAGANGAGKTTFYRTRLAPLGLPFVNADEIARELYPADPEGYSYQAAQVAAELRQQLLLERRSFCFETVFSHPSKVDFLARAKAFGYQVILVFIHLESASLNKARVSQRVAGGGHRVPEAKVQSRIPRVLHNVRLALPLCDQVRALDNSRLDNPYSQVFSLRDGQLAEQVTGLPAWARYLLHPPS